MSLGSQVKRRAQDAARSGALGLAGVLCLFPGVAFLTCAAWLVLDRAGGALFAAQVLGVFYTGLAFVFAYLAMRSHPSHRESAASAPDEKRAAAKGTDPEMDQPAERVMEAFFKGVEAGRRTQAAWSRR